MTFFKKLARWFRKEEEKKVTGRRVPKFATFYGIEETADRLKRSKERFFRMRSGGVYAVAVNKAGEPTHFLRVDKDSRPPKVRKHWRRAMKAKAILSSGQIIS